MIKSNNVKNLNFCFLSNNLLPVKNALFIYLFISDAKTYIRIYTHTKKKRNINPKTCTIEKDKFKTKLAKSIDNNAIYTMSQMTSMT